MKFERSPTTSPCHLFPPGQKLKAEKMTCANKNRYPAKKAALTERNLIMKRHRRNHPNSLRAYACPDCQGWHLTKT